jgi:phosphatidylglycerophosphatase A
MAEGHEPGAISRKIAEAQAKRARARAVRGPADFLALAVATGLGTGFAPFAPGTFGSLLGVAIFYGLMAAFKFEPSLLLNSVLVASVISAALGTWAATRAEKVFEQKDAGQIVIDEVCGQLISFTFVAPALVEIGGRWRWALLAGFALFRLFDIFKPYPIRRLEALGSGLGVMADDILAGIYAAIVLSLLLPLAF